MLDPADPLDQDEPLGPDQVDEAVVDHIAEHTGPLRETVMYLLSRTPGYHGYEAIDKSTRNLASFSTAQATTVLIQTRALRGHWDDIVCAAAPTKDPLSFLPGAIDAAAAPLMDKALVLDTTRPGARHSRFLPGGWLPAAPGSKAMEVWQTPLYLLWKDTKTRPAVWAYPLLPTHRQLFTDAWQRVCDGDAPRYEQLHTSRYRRRR